MTATATATLAQTVAEATAAEQLAAKAQRAAEEARQRAAEAKAQADEQRRLANERYLDLLVSEHREARTALLETQVEARTALESAVRGEGGDIFQCYRDWTRASLEAWAEEHALANQRLRQGKPTRDPNPPVFAFGADIAAILDQHTLDIQAEIEERWQDRRQHFLNGATQ